MQSDNYLNMMINFLKTIKDNNAKVINLSTNKEFLSIIYIKDKNNKETIFNKIITLTQLKVCNVNKNNINNINTFDVLITDDLNKIINYGNFRFI